MQLLFDDDELELEEIDRGLDGFPGVERLG
jgi:hypothetical protein